MLHLTFCWVWLEFKTDLKFDLSTEFKAFPFRSDGLGLEPDFGYLNLYW